MQALILLLMLPIMIFNFGAGIVGLVWLMFSGGWPAILVGIGALVLGPFAIGVAMLPGMAIAVPAIGALQSGRVSTAMALPLLILSSFWTYVVLTVWCVGSFVILLNNFEGDLIPRMLWAYAVATGPWTFMAQKEAATDRDSQAPMTAFFAQVGCLSIMLSIWIGNGYQSAFGMALFFVPLMGLAIAFQAFSAWLAYRNDPGIYR